MRTFVNEGYPMLVCIPCRLELVAQYGHNGKRQTELTEEVLNGEQLLLPF